MNFKYFDNMIFQPKRLVAVVFFFLLFFSQSVFAQFSIVSNNGTSGCINFGATFSVAGTGATSYNYNWVVTNSSGATIQTGNNANFTVLFTSPSIYDLSVTLTPTSGGASTTVDSLNYITIYGSPSISYNISPGSGCAGDCLVFDESGSNPGSNSSGLNSFVVSPGDGSPSYNIDDFTHCYNTPGTFTPIATFINNEGCQTTSNLTPITIDTIPVLTSSTNITEICSGDAFNYTPTSSVTGSTIIAQMSQTGNPSCVNLSTTQFNNTPINEIITHSCNTPQTVEYTITITNNNNGNSCDSVFLVNVIVKPKPVITISNQTICVGGSATLDAVGGSGSGTYLWSPGGQTTQSITVSPGSTTNYTCIYTEDNCPSDPAAATVTVNSLPTVTVNNTTVCAGSPATLTATPGTPGGTYLWSPGGANTQNITVSPSTTTTYTVTYTLGCEGTGSGTVTTNPAPTNSIASTFYNSCSFPLITDLTFVGTNADSIEWTFSNGSLNNSSVTGALLTGTNPAIATGNIGTHGNLSNVNFSGTDIYDIAVTTWNNFGCSTTTSFPQFIAVGNNNPPGSNIYSFSPAFVCINDPISIAYDEVNSPSNHLNGSTGAIANEVWWDWGDGSALTLQTISQNVLDFPVPTTHSYSLPGTYTITMVPWGMIGGVYVCSGDTLTQQVTVLGPAATLAVNIDCNNPLTPTLSPTYYGTGGTTNYLWDFGDGSATNNTAFPPSHTYPFYDTTYTITLTVTDVFGCPPVTLQESVVFYDNQPTFQAYNQSDTTQANGGFVKTDICLGDELWFYNETPGSAYVSPQNINSLQTRWDWDANGIVSFSASTAVRGQGRSRIFSSANGYAVGKYGIAIRNEDPNGCRVKDTAIDYITIHGIDGDFTLPTFGCVNDSINVGLGSLDAPMSYIDTIFWDWGDGSPVDTTIGSSSVAPGLPPAHAYTTSGTYTVTATVSDSAYCPISLIHDITITSPTASFNVDFLHICPGQGINAVDNSSGTGAITNYAWSAPNATPNSSSNQNPGTFVFNNPGTFPITLSVTDVSGCIDDTTINIDVYDLVIDASASQTFLSCFSSGTAISFSNLSHINNLPGFQHFDLSSAVWNFGNNSTSGLFDNPFVTYTAPGSYDVSLTLSSLSGCTATAIVETIVVQGPSGTVFVGGGGSNTIICSGQTADITVSSADADSVVLFYDDGSIEVVPPLSTQTYTHTYTNNGTTVDTIIPQLFVRDNGLNCSGLVISLDTIFVNPLPIINPVTNIDLCSGDNSGAINFTSNIPGTNYSWINNNTNTGLGAAGNGNIPSFPATASTTTESSSVIVTPSYDPGNGLACSGNAILFFINVTPTPSIQSILDEVVCNGSFTNGIVFNVSPASSVATWTNNTPSIGLPAGPTTSTGINSFVAINNTSSSVNANITVSTQNGACPGNSVSFDYIVNPTPIVNPTNDTTLCEGQNTLQIDFAGNVAGASYDWQAIVPANATAIGMSSTNGSGSIPSFTTTNSTSNQISAEIIVTPTANNCSGVNDTFLIIVNPTPVVNSINDTTLCHNEFTNDIDFTSNISGTSYSWTNNNTNIGLAANGTGLQIPSFQVSNTSNTTITSTIIVTPSLNGCSGLSESFLITVNPIPDVLPTNDTIYCSGNQSINYLFDGFVLGASYNWSANTAPNSAAIGMPSATGINTIPPFTTTLPSSTPISVDITVSPFFLGCTGNSDVFTITVDPTPSINNINDSTYCSGEISPTIFFTGTAGASYSWTNNNPNVGLAANGVDSIPSFVTTSLTNIVETATITVTPTFGNCPGPSTSFTITVNPSPTVAANPGVNQILCEGDPSQAVAFNGLAGTVYQWNATPATNSIDIGMPAASGTGNIPSFISNNPSPGNTSISTNIQITPELNGCLGSPISFGILVDPAATVNAGNDTTICDLGNLMLNGSFGGSASSITWSTSGDGAFGSTITQITSYTPGANDIGVTFGATITLTTNDPAGSCPSVQDDLILTISSSAIVNAGNDTTICEGSNANLQGSFGGSASSIFWTTNGDGVFSSQIINNPSYSPGPNDITNGSVMIYLTSNAPSAFCPAAVDSLLLTISPTPTINAMTPQIVCGGLNTTTINFTGTTGSSYSWVNSNTLIGLGSGPTSATNIPAFATTNNSSVQFATITVTPSLGACPGTPETVLITINPTPDINPTNDTVLCAGDSLNSYLFNGSIPGSNFNWVANPSTAATSIGLNPNSGANSITGFFTNNNIISNTNVEIVITPELNGCFGTNDTFNITLNPASIIDAINGPIGLCIGGTASLSASFTGASTNVTWTTSGDGTFDNASSLTPVYTPGANDISAASVMIYITTDVPTGICNATMDSVLINISSGTIVSAGVDTNVCDNVDIQLNGSFGGAASSITWTGGLGTFNPDNTDPLALYTPDPSEILAGSVTLTITTDDPAGPCPSASDQVTFTIFSGPVANAGNDTTICEGDSVLINGSFSGIATSLSWTTSGDGTFLNANSLSTYYFPGANDISNGSATLFATTDNPGGAPCFAFVDSLILSINPAAIVNAGNDTSICLGDSIILNGTFSGSATSVTWSTSGDGTFNNNTLANASYTPGINDQATGSVTLTITSDNPAGPCGDTTDSMLLTINSIASVSAGNDTTICNGNSISLQGNISGAAATWTTQGDGAFDDPTIQNPIYTPGTNDSLATTVTLILTTNSAIGTCLYSTDTITITLSTPATVSAGVDTSICSNGNVFLNGQFGGSASFITWNGSGTFNTNANDPNAIYTPSLSAIINGTDTLIIETDTPFGPCPSATDTLVITIDSSAIVDAGIDTVICEGNNVQLNASISPLGTTFLWSTLGDGTFNDPSLLNPIYTPGPIDITNSIVNNIPITLVIETTASIGSCLYGTDTMNVSILSGPTANAGVDVTICDTIPVNLTGVIGGTAVSATWSTPNGFGSFSSTNNLLTTYSPTLNDLTQGFVNIVLNTNLTGGACGQASDTMTIFLQTSPILDAGLNDTICTGNTVTLNGSCNIGATWSGGLGTFDDNTLLNATYTPDPSETSVILTLTSINPGGSCISVSDSVEIIIENAPSLTNNDTIICSDSLVDIILTSTVNSTFVWSAIDNPNTTGETTSIQTSSSINDVIINNSTSAQIVLYEVTPTSIASACPGPIDTISVTINPTPIISFVDNDTMCNNSQSTPVVWSTNIPGTNITWANNNNTIGLALNGSGDISSFTGLNGSPLTNNIGNINAVPEINGCFGDTLSFEFVVLPEVLVDPVLNQVICANDTITSINFTTGGSNNPNIVYNWLNDAPSIGLPSSGSGNIGSFTGINNNTVDTIATITVVPVDTSNNCLGDTLFFTITVRPTPSLLAPADQTICVGTATNAIIFNPTPAATTSCNWSTNLQGIGFPGANGVGNIPPFITNSIAPGTNIDTAIVTAVPVSNINSCPGDTVTFNIIVIPSLTVSVPLNDTLCGGDNYPGAIFTGSITGTSFTWSNDNTSIGLNATGNGDIGAFTVDNTGTVDQTATITVTPNYIVSPSQTCTGIVDSFKITVKPQPNVFPVGNQSICALDSFALVDFSGNIPGTIFNWEHNNISIGLNTPGIGDIPAFQGLYSGTTTQTAFIQVIPEFNGCFGDTVFFELSVNPIPTVDQPIPAVYCPNEMTNIVTFDGNLGSATTYNWTFSNNTIGNIPTPGGTGIDTIQPFLTVNGSPNEVVSVVTVTPTYNGCVGDDSTFTVTINPEPSVNPEPDQILCVNTLTSTINFNGPVLNTTYSWTSVNANSIGLNPATGLGSVPAFLTQNNSPSSLTAQIIVVPTYTSPTNGVQCVGLQDIVEITVIDPLPIITPTPDANYCSGQIVPITFFTGNNINNQYVWSTNNTSIGTGLAANGIGDIPSFTASTVTAPQTAEFIVIPEIGSCQGVADTFYITINPTPNVYNPGNQILCANTMTSAVNFFGDLPGTTFNWTHTNNSIGINTPPPNSGNINPFLSQNNTNTIQIDLITVTPELNGCIGDDSTFSITVNPISSVNVNDLEYCHNDIAPDINFTGSNPNSTYDWTNSNPTISTVPLVNGVNTVPSFTASNLSLINQIGTFMVVPMLQTGSLNCAGDTSYFTITVKPIPTAIPPANIVLCGGQPTTNIVWDGNMVDSTIFNWTHSNTSVGNPPVSQNGVDTVFSFVTNNTSPLIIVDTITVTPVLNGCVGQDTMMTITINPTTIVNTSNDTVCAGEYVDSISFNSPNPGTTYTWTATNISIGINGNGIDTIPGFIAANSGTTLQTCDIIVTPDIGGCGGINDTFQIVVRPMPIVDPTLNQDLCANDSINGIYFTGNMPSNTYNWTNNNSSIGLNISGNDSIPSYAVINTGISIETATIIVTPELNGCFGLNDTFSITVYPLPQVFAGFDTLLCFGQPYTPSGSGAVSYDWTPGTNGTPFFINDTTSFIVIGTDTNLCQNSDTVVVNYILDPPPIVNAGPDSAICDGFPITLSATGNANLYVWDNITPPSLGVVDGVPFIPPYTDDYIVIGYDASTGCYNSDTVQIIVHPFISITANANATALCENDMLTLWGSGATPVAIYTWDNGVTDSVGFIPQVGTETYTLIGTDGNNCSDTTDITITVNPNPTANFVTNMNIGGCLPFCPTFTDMSSPGSASVQWFFGNGTTSNQLGDVINCYDDYGTYDVTLITTTLEGCSDTLTIPSIINVEPVIAAFSSDYLEQPIANPVFEFTNESINGVTFVWDFGDGSGSSIIHPTHSYNDIGFYEVMLVAIPQDGIPCADTATMLVKINDEVILYVPNTFTPDGDGLNDIFLPIVTAGFRDGTYEFRIYNRWGEQVFVTEDPTLGWDGTYLGVPVQDGTYTWTILFKDPLDNGKFPFNGHVNLIK